MEIRKSVTKDCSHCGNSFYQFKTTDKYCSYRCKMSAKIKRKGTAWNPNLGNGLCHKNGSEIMNDLKLNRGYVYCQKCGASNTRFERHHIIFRSEKPGHEHLHSKLNILIVCVPCHEWFHKSKGNRNELVLHRQLHLLFGNEVLDK